MRAVDERTVWDALAAKDPRWAVWGEDDWDAGIEECLPKALGQLPAAGGKVLDLGCGVGRLAVPIAERGYEVVGVDVSPRMLEAAERHERVEYRRGDGRAIPARDGEFDGAYSVLLFQHVELDTVRRYMREVYRTLRPGGTFGFQFVEGDEDVELSRQRSWRDVAAWLAEAGFADAGDAWPMPSEAHPNWRWWGARRP